MTKRLMRVRQHRGSLHDAMQTVVSIEPTFEALTLHVNDIIGSVFQGEHFKKEAITVRPYGWDQRVQWNTHIIHITGFGVFGFCDQMPSGSGVVTTPEPTKGVINTDTTMFRK